MKKTSIRELYYYAMFSHIFMLICGLGGGVLIICNFREFINTYDKITGIIFLIVILCCFVVMFVSSFLEIVTLLKDIKSMIDNDFVSVVGKVVKFKKNREPESGVQTNDHPIIRIEGTNEEIVLLINDRIVRGKTYKFNYLKNSKIAEVVEMIEIDTEERIQGF